jgi:hypothetical protein
MPPACCAIAFVVTKSHSANTNIDTLRMVTVFIRNPLCQVGIPRRDHKIRFFLAALPIGLGLCQRSWWKQWDYTSDQSVVKGQLAPREPYVKIAGEDPARWIDR